MSGESEDEKVPMRYILREISETVKTTGKDVSELKGDMTKVKTIVLGDKDTETPGLAHRVNKLEKNEKHQSRILMVASAIGAGVVFVIEYLPKLIGKLFPVILIYGDILLLLLLIVAGELLN